MVYNKILNNVYLSNYKDSINNEYINDNNIKVIINCSKNLPFINNNNIIKIRISINDDLSKQSNIDLFKYLNNITTIMNKYTKQNYNILVHCYAGIQRSPSIIAAYLIRYYNFSMYEAINYIKQKKNKTFYPKINFYNSLNKYQLVN